MQKKNSTIIKTFWMLPYFALFANAHIVTFDQISPSKNIIQIASLSDMEDNIIEKLDGYYDIYIRESKDSNLLYVVNIEDNEKDLSLNYLKILSPDAYLSKKFYPLIRNELFIKNDNEKYLNNTVNFNEKAIDLLKINESKKAYDFLENSYKQGNFNNQTLFLLGTSAKNNGDLENAIKYFKLLLLKDGRANRVRLDLSMLYYKKKDLKKAKELLLIVKASNPPKKVSDNIDSFLTTIENTSKNYSLNASIGYLYNSNVNVGTSSDTIFMYDLPFILSDDAKESKDYAMTYNFGIKHTKPFKQFTFQSSANINITDYNKLNNLDHILLSTSISPTWKYSNQTTFLVPFTANIVKYGHSDNYYSINKGISPQINYLYDPKLLLSASLSFNWEDYYKEPEKKSHSWLFSPYSQYFINQSSWVRVGVNVGKEDSKTSTNSNNLKGLSLEYYKAFSQKMNIYLSTLFNNTSYGGTELAYNKSRDDKSATISFNLSYYLQNIKSNISLNTSYTKNNSNIQMYDYSRKMISISSSYKF